MLNLNKCTKTKPKPMLNFKNCSYVSAYHCAQLSYITRHRTVLIIFPLILQTISTPQMMSTAGEGGLKLRRRGWAGHCQTLNAPLVKQPFSI